MGIRIGIDSGGTFTDLIAIDDESGRIYPNKEPSTPSQPLIALHKIIAGTPISPGEVSRLVLGTTVATNALIERQGANVLFLATQGTQDMLNLQMANRPRNYDLLWRRPTPFVKRRNCLGVDERVDHHGQIIVPLTPEKMAALADAIQTRIERDGIEAVALCLLFSYINPTHEQMLSAYLRQRFPGLLLSVSHEVAPVWREYERGNTTAADAFVKPLVTRYVQGAQQAFDALAVNGAHCLIKSNGGMALLDVVPDRPVDTLLSGLVAGVIAGQFFGGLAGERNLITFDMGGTSCDVGLVVDGSPNYTTQFDVEWGLPISNPVIDVRTVGAGGGSIGWVDRGGFLRVGPQSAGAEPGPACYGAGGREATVTDANLVLGRLNPDYFLGGKMPLSVDLARHALHQLSEKARLGVRETALNVLQLVNNTMASTIRLVTVEKGIDPRGYALVAFGGAGALHACSVARELQLSKVIVPIYPGQCSAFGTLIADVRVDRMWTHAFRSDRLQLEAVAGAFARMVDEARSELRRSGFMDEPTVKRYVSMRYLEQNYEEDILLADGPITLETIARAYQEFHARHVQFYGYSFPEEIMELVHFKVMALGPAPKLHLPKLAAHGPLHETVGRLVYLSDPDEPVSCPVYQRADLPAGVQLKGPAIIEEAASTTLVEPDFSLTVDAYGNLILTQEAAQ